MSPFEKRVYHIDYIFIHLSCMHRLISRFPHIISIIPYWKKKDGKWRKRLERGLLSKKKIESSKDEVARLMNMLEQVLNINKGKGTSTQPPVEILSIHAPHKENIIDFSPQYSTSRSHKHWSGIVSPSSSNEQQQQCLQPSTHDNRCFSSDALLIVHCLYIYFQ